MRKGQVWQINMSAARGTPTKGIGAGAVPATRKDSTAIAIQRIKQQREDRRRSAEHFKKEKLEEAARIEASGMPIFDADFQRMISVYRASAEAPKAHSPPGEHDICVVVRKRPINKREIAGRDWDAVTCLNPKVIVHAPKYKVDGITKFLENTSFGFDHTFDENSTTDDVYKFTVMPLVAYAFQKRGRGTCVAYGQTGSGKSFTISGIQQLVARDIFRALQSKDFKDRGFTVHVSFLEIYGARCSDLLHGRNKVSIMEDGKQRVVAAGLEDVECSSTEDLLEIIARGNSERTTHATEVNSQSSRSHAICEVAIKSKDGKVHGSLSLVDLAGSERAADSRNHNRQRRLEGAEINKSLLALKECIRALAMRASAPEDAHVHVPFRASKLTLALRDSFISSNSRVVMVATVSPNASSADHTQNTLRYADRVKEKALDGSVFGDDEPSTGSKDGKVRHDVTFSFLQAAPGGGKGSSDDAAPVLPRMSPLTIDEEPAAVSSAAKAGARGAAKPSVASRITRSRAAIAESKRSDDDDHIQGVDEDSKSDAGVIKRSQLPDVSDSKSLDSIPEDDDEGRAVLPVRAAPFRSPPARNLGPAARLPMPNRGMKAPTNDIDIPEDNVEIGTSLLSPPATKIPPAQGHAGGFRKLLKPGPTVPSGQSAASSKDDGRKHVAAPVDDTANPTVQPGPARADLRNKLRERGKIFKTASSSNVTAPAGASHLPTSSPTSSDDDDDNLDDLLGRAGLPKEDEVNEDGRIKSRLVKSFMPLPGSRYPGDRISTSSTGTASRVSTDGPTRSKPSASSSAKHVAAHRAPVVSSMPSPQRDLALVHTLRRDELRSRGGEVPRPLESDDSVEESALMQFHETAGVILDEEEDLLNAHMAAIQENAELLTDEGKLLAEVQGRDVIDYDIDRYATRLHDLLSRKIATTQKLLRQLTVFRDHLAFEEQVSKQVHDEDLRLA